MARIKSELDLRRFPPIPRMTKQFERLYKGRTAVERVNARLKLYWGADDGNVVGARRFHAMVGVVMLVHLALGTTLAGRGRGTIEDTGRDPPEPDRASARRGDRARAIAHARDDERLMTTFGIPQYRHRYPQGDLPPLAPRVKRQRKRLLGQSPRHCKTGHA